MTRREEARALRDEGLSLRVIGARIGISGERVRQLLSPEYKLVEVNLCRGCGKEIVGHPAWKYCRNPCVSKEEQPTTSKCHMCGKEFPGKQGKRYCHKPCPYRPRTKSA